MKYWLTTDTHFYHDILYERDALRPKDFHDRVVAGLRQCVQPGSVLIHIGDICIGNDAKCHEEIISPLPCKKWLVRGNHDGKTSSWYLQHGWDMVCDLFEMTLFGKRIVFTHIPVADYGYDLNIHGHYHNTNWRKFEPELIALYGDKHKLLALEYTAYRPVLLDSFLEGKVGRVPEE